MGKWVTYLLREVCFVPLPSSLCLGLSSAPVGVEEDMVRSLAKELVEESLEMLVRAFLTADSGLPGLPTSSKASLPFPGAGGGFSSTGTMYDNMATQIIYSNVHSPLLALMYIISILISSIFSYHNSKLSLVYHSVCCLPYTFEEIWNIIKIVFFYQESTLTCIVTLCNVGKIKKIRKPKKNK